MHHHHRLQAAANRHHLQAGDHRRHQVEMTHKDLAQVLARHRGRLLVVQVAAVQAEPQAAGLVAAAGQAVDPALVVTTPCTEGREAAACHPVMELPKTMTMVTMTTIKVTRVVVGARSPAPLCLPQLRRGGLSTTP
jgi:hypothetical protein